MCDITGPGNSTSHQPDVTTVTVRPKNNDWNYSGNADILYLDGQDVACDHNEAISQFEMAVDGRRRSIRYNFSCSRSSKITNNCQDKHTHKTHTDSNSRQSIHFLDRHDMTCGDNWVIRRFKLDRSGKSIQYSYTCCQTTNTGMCSMTTSPFFYIDGKNVDSLPNTAFSRIKLNALITLNTEGEGANYTYDTSQCYIN